MQHAKRRLPSSAADRPGHRRIPQAKGIKFAWIDQAERAGFRTTRWTLLVLTECRLSKATGVLREGGALETYSNPGVRYVLARQHAAL